jgi:hypothetical protein
MADKNHSPQLSEFEKLKLENFVLRQYALESQLRQNTVDRAIFLHGIEEAHPGWRWRDPEGLVPMEDEEDLEPAEDELMTQ